MQMLVGFFAGPACHRVLRRFQLHDHAGETLRESVMDVARHAVALFENGRALTLLGKFIELDRKHDLMCERLGQFDLFRSVGRAVRMPNPNETSYLPTD